MAPSTTNDIRKVQRNSRADPIRIDVEAWETGTTTKKNFSQTILGDASMENVFY